MNKNLDDFKELYFKTAHEYVNSLNSGMETLGPNPASEKFSDLHRFAHSLKSQSAVMKYTKIAELAGVLEELFDQLQKGEQQLNPDMLAEINKSINTLQTSLAELETGKQPNQS